MALVLKLSLNKTVNSDFTNGLDLTGAYNPSTNPTGFGAPNPTRGDVSAVTISMLRPKNTVAETANIFVSPYQYLSVNEELVITPSMFASPNSFTITDASNTTPIVITTSTAHGLTQGQYATVMLVEGNLAANGYWTAIPTSATTFELQGSAGSGAYVAATGFVTASTADTSFIDGVYLFTIDAVIDGDPYSVSQYYLHYDLIDCCISKQVAQQSKNNCKDLTKYSELKAMLDAAKDAFNCKLYSQAQLLIDRLTKLCADCGCGCGGGC